MQTKYTVAAVIIIVLVGVAAFFGGMKYQQSKAPAGTFAAQFGSNGKGGVRFFRNGDGNGKGNGGATVGEITSVDANSITVKLSDGSSKIVNLSGSTTYMKSATGSSSDLKTGDRVAAMGTTNSDGSITAQTIQLNPMFGERRKVTPTP